MPPTRYCSQCRIGTLDASGLCVLCGAPAQPSTGWRRVAESSAGAIAGVFSPTVLVPALLLAIVALYATVARSGVAGRFPAVGVRRPLMLDLPAAFAAVHADPAGGLLRLLAPALLQAVIFALLLLLALFFIRRRRPAPGNHAEDRHALHT
jgi:hypothetical protein